MAKQKILVVEDNPEYIAAASEFFNQKGIGFRVAKDYVEAVVGLVGDSSNVDYRGAIVDCFFSEETGRNYDLLGKIAIDRMRSLLPDSQTPNSRALTQVGDVLGEEFAKFAAKNAGADYSRDSDPYRRLEKAIEKYPSNQPLGILVGEKLEEAGIPFVLATSTHHHDSLTQPIQDYCSRRGWRLLDCPRDQPEQKATPEFWRRAYSSLETEM